MGADMFMSLGSVPLPSPNNRYPQVSIVNESFDHLSFIKHKDDDSSAMNQIANPTRI